MKHIIVRCTDRMVFPVNPKTLEPLSTSYYDPYCYSAPLPETEYMEHSTWCLKKQELSRY